MPDTIQLTNEEQLQLQNLELRRHLIIAKATMNETQAREVTARIGERLGVDLTQYRLDADTGKGKRIQRVQAVPDEPKEPEEAVG